MHKLTWAKKRPRYKRSDSQHYSISSKLKADNKTNDEFEVMLSRLTLEELISLKLEVAARAVNHKLYGFDLWRKIPTIARDALLKYAYTGTRTKMEMASFLGVTRQDLDRWLKKLNLEDYFTKTKNH
jgi:hypothetical protein